MNCSETRALEPLYDEGAVDAASAADYETHLRDCASCRARHAEALAFGQVLKRDLRRYRAPLELRARIRSRIAPARGAASLRYLARGWNPVALAASLALSVALSSTFTAQYVAAPSDSRVVEDVVSSHVRSLMGNHLIDVASSDRHTVRPWFIGKVDAAPPAVDLASAGFPLIGGRLDYVDRHPCAVLVYRHDKHVINVMVWTNESAEPARTETYARQGYNLVRFAEGDLTFWAVSDLDRGELADFVRRFEDATASPSPS
ncbi:MAG TPA: zf-HC2 domain-containing protein [Stellaceae bacterium]|nr:zf-HC2 domain-containing protein [Stellaceae bacterium]